MKKMLTIELKKAFFSKSFLAGLFLLTLFSTLSAVYMIENWGEYNPEYIYEAYQKNGDFISNPILPLYSFFGAWLGGDVLSLANTMFFFFLPIGAALPYSWSLYTEEKCGYVKNIVTRTSRKNYYISKWIAVFCSGAAVVLIPYIFNILLVTAYIPYYKPWAGYNLYNSVYFGTMWSDLFFRNPTLHMMLYTLLNTLYGGIFSLLSLNVSCFIKKIIPILFTPFLSMLLFGYAETAIYERFFNDKLVLCELVPTRFLHSRDTHYLTISWVVTLITIILLICCVIPILFVSRSKKDELH